MKILTFTLMLSTLCFAGELTNSTQFSKQETQDQINRLTRVLNKVSKELQETVTDKIFDILQDEIDPPLLYTLISNLSNQRAQNRMMREYFPSYKQPTVDSKTIIDEDFYISFLKQAESKLDKASYEKILEIIKSSLSKMWDTISKKLTPSQATDTQTPQITTLSAILNRILSTRSLSQSIFTIFDVLQDKIDDALLFQLITNLQNTDIKQQLIMQYFPSGYKSTTKSTTVIDNQFYATFLDNLSHTKNMPDDLMTSIQDTIKPFLRKDWADINKLRQQATSDSWGTATYPTQAQEIDKLLKERNPNPSKIKAQLVVDLVDAYKQAPDQITSGGFGEDDKPTNFGKLRNAVNSLTTLYGSKLSQKGVKTDFLPVLNVSLESAIQWATPRFTNTLFQQYVGNLQPDSKNKVSNGFRINLDQTFTEYQNAKKNNANVTFNSDYLYLMCFQMLASLEAKITTGQSPSKYDDFIAQAATTLDGLAQGLNHEGNIDAVVASLKASIPSRVEKTPDPIILGRFIGLLITKLQISGEILNILNNRLKVALADLQTSPEAVKAFEKTLKDNLDALSKITTVDGSKIVSFLNVQQTSAQQSSDNKSENSIDKAMKGAEKIANSSIGKKIFGNLGGLFG